MALRRDAASLPGAPSSTFFTRSRSMSKLHHTTPIEVKYRDTDSVGHVSSPVYYDYLQHAYIKYMFHLLQLPHEEKLPHIMVKTSCEYLKPARFGDSLTVRSSVTKFGTKSFELEYLMCLDKGDDADAEPEIIARGASTHVMFDHGSQRTAAVPDDFKNRVLAFQGAL
jgi:acyl-CoA thioester hydrolase